MASKLTAYIVRGLGLLLAANSQSDRLGGRWPESRPRVLLLLQIDL